jgi:hypothetical protein
VAFGLTACAATGIENPPSSKTVTAGRTNLPWMHWRDCFPSDLDFMLISFIGMVELEY